MENNDFYVTQGKDGGESPEKDVAQSPLRADVDFIIPGDESNNEDPVFASDDDLGVIAPYDDIMIVQDFDSPGAHYAKNGDKSLLASKEYSEAEQAEESFDEYKRAEREKTSEGGFFKRHKMPVIIVSSAVLFVCALGAVLYVLFANGILQNPFGNNKNSVMNEQGEFTFLDGITVSGLDISGMTYNQAKTLLENNQEKFQKPFNLTVEANGVDYKLDQSYFQYTYDIEETLKRAKTYCLGVSDGDIKPTQPQTDENGNKIEQFEVTATVTSDSITAVSDEISDKTDVEAQNAKVSKFHPFEENKFEYADGVAGLETDRQTLSSDIKAFIITGKTQGTIGAKVSKAEPEVNVDAVKAAIVPLSSFSTTSYNTANGTANMETALNACNGSVIEPGATWSFNGCTGNSNLESNGYKSAAVINEGKTEQGIGGGICQASSTIYNAAIFANMEIAERYCHYWASTYVYSGLDATIDYPNLDLKLKNKTDFQMFIECGVNGSKLICNIYGYKDPFYDDIATYSENYNISSSSYSARAYRIYYKDGTEVGREELPSSYYSLSDGHSVRAADSGTHLVLPDGTSMKKEKDEETKPKEEQPQEEEPEEDNPPQSSKTEREDPPSSSSSTPEPKPEPPTTPPPTEAPPVTEHNGDGE